MKHLYTCLEYLPFGQVLFDQGPGACVSAAACCCRQAINQTVQKTLRQLKADCATIQATIEQRKQQDAANRETNSSRTTNGVLLLLGDLLVLVLLVGALAARTVGAVCSMPDSGAAGFGSSRSAACSSMLMQTLQEWDARIENTFGVLVGVLLALALVFGGGAKVVWRHEPVLNRRQLKKLDEYAAVVAQVAQQAEVLWEEYFLTLANAEER